jgi:hypothetical protein
MTERDVKVQGPFPKRLRKVSVVCVVEVIIELEADSENAVSNLVLSLSNVK